MKERSKYHISDIINLIVFYCVFICFTVALIVGLVDFVAGNLELHRFLFRFAFVFVMCLPYIIRKVFKMVFSRVTTIIFYIYMFLAAFLGIVLRFYDTVPVWDMVIHFLMGIVLSVFAIYILNYTIYKKDKSRHNLFFTFLFMIMFAMGIGALWEIWEFSGDVLFGLYSQRFLDQNMVPLVGQAALMDTMLDICMELSGSLIAVVAISFLTRYYKGFLKSFKIKRLKDKSEIEEIEE